MDPVERVKNMVRHTLVVKPDVSNRELLARAQEIAPEAVDGLSLRQFHGKYRLPIVRFEMAPRKARKNGAAEHADGEAKAGTRSSTTAKATPPSTKQKRGRRKTSGAQVEIHGEVRQVLVDFAIELEKAERRSELVGVMAGVDDFVNRIVSVADNAYTRRSRSTA
ncbi:MAG TPA: hypothetical protein VMM79_07850 [Longimicrobiales bacterium]|nr:hypothetical protein [Longimicrobiales bacterium]